VQVANNYPGVLQGQNDALEANDLRYGCLIPTNQTLWKCFQPFKTTGEKYI
jgi:hypothetical protein